MSTGISIEIPPGFSLECVQSESYPLGLFADSLSFGKNGVVVVKVVNKMYTMDMYMKKQYPLCRMVLRPNEFVRACHNASEMGPMA